MSDAAATGIGGVRNLDRETAGLLRRGAAGLLDALILSPLWLLFWLPYIRLAIRPETGLSSLAYEPTWWRFVVAFASAFAYGALMLGRYGRTVGMMPLRIRVTNRDGSDIGFSRAALRTAIFLLPFAVGGIVCDNEVVSTLVKASWTFGLLWIMVDRAHQGYHDKIAGTLMMREHCYQQRKAACPSET
jgi:uncharacterized RDD family membrane protein YckC